MEKYAVIGEMDTQDKSAAQTPDGIQQQQTRECEIFANSLLFLTHKLLYSILNIKRDQYGTGDISKFYQRLGRFTEDFDSESTDFRMKIRIPTAWLKILKASSISTTP